MLLALSMASCDSGGSSGYTPSSINSQPTTRTVNCAYCNGGGVVLNPYDSNYYYCQNCGGTGKVKVTTGGSNPSFTGGKYKCGSHGCYCNIKRSELEAAGLIRCSCDHITTIHHD